MAATDNLTRILDLIDELEELLNSQGIDRYYPDYEPDEVGFAWVDNALRNIRQEVKYDLQGIEQRRLKHWTERGE